MKTINVELFIHKTVTGEIQAVTSDMSNYGWPLLGRKTLTIQVPKVDEIEAEIEVLSAQENRVIEEANSRTFDIREKIQSLRDKRNDR